MLSDLLTMFLEDMDHGKNPIAVILCWGAALVFVAYICVGAIFTLFSGAFYVVSLPFALIMWMREIPVRRAEAAAKAEVEAKARVKAKATAEHRSLR